MKFLCLYKPSKPEGTPPTQKEMEEMGTLVQDSMKAGFLLATEGCLPSAKGARVILAGGKYTVTDGPFTEAKEMVAGMAILKTNSWKRQSSTRRTSSKLPAMVKRRSARCTKPGTGNRGTSRELKSHIVVPILPPLGWGHRQLTIRDNPGLC